MKNDRQLNNYTQSKRAIQNWKKLRLLIQQMRQQPNYLVTFLYPRDALNIYDEQEQYQEYVEGKDETDDDSPFLIKSKDYPCVYMII